MLSVMFKTGGSIRIRINKKLHYIGTSALGVVRTITTDVKSECPAFGKTCHKCGRNNHFVSVCGKIPYRKSAFRSKSGGRQTSVNELNQSNCDSGVTLTSTSIPRNTEYGHVSNTVPKQVLDVVNLANKGNSGTNLRHHLELDTLCTTPMKSQPTQVFSNIEIDGVLICGKQDTGAEVNTMPLKCI